MAELAFHEKRRGVVKASPTKLRTKLTDLEGDTTVPTPLESARNKLDTLHQDFKTHQLAIIDCTDEGEALAGEQQVHDQILNSVSYPVSDCTDEGEALAGEQQVHDQILNSVSYPVSDNFGHNDQDFWCSPSGL